MDGGWKVSPWTSPARGNHFNWSHGEVSRPGPTAFAWSTEKDLLVLMRLELKKKPLRFLPCEVLGLCEVIELACPAEVPPWPLLLL